MLELQAIETKVAETETVRDTAAEASVVELNLADLDLIGGGTAIFQF
jgi:hypothetical protein